MLNMRRCNLVKIVAYSFLLFSCQSQATLIVSDSSKSTEQLGNYEASVNWIGNELIIDLKNTSNHNNGGYLTGFLLKLPPNTSFTNANSNTSMQVLYPKQNSYSASPFGNYDYGFALGGAFLGGGSPKKGIGVGETARFTLSNWTGLPNQLTTSQQIENYMLDAISTPELGDVNFIVRFRGFNDGGSDKVPARIKNTPPPPPITVPSSSTLALFVTALCLLLCLLRNLNKSANAL